MRIIFLGTGTSHGVPVIGCDCEVCTSLDSKNRRTRSSVWIQQDNTDIIIDTAVEFRLQALREGLTKVDGVLYTHCHADHVFGFDDLRIFSQRTNIQTPIYGNKPTIEEIYQVFSYVFRKTQEGGGKPQVNPIVVTESFYINNVRIIPVPIFHGELPILGYRIGKMAYLTDCSRVPEESLKLLEGVEILILGVIRYEPHPTHMHVEKALELISILEPKRTYFTHISHLLEHRKVNKELPDGVELAYDGLIVQV
ncbi:MAG: MBL fold metallo-hydrolase [Firmicutes bacterium]|nr:MBL fold metallo-hydrolase [Bacillota bacterium]